MQFRNLFPLVLACILAIPSAGQTLIPVDKNMLQSLNGDWSVQMDNSSSVAKVRVPGNWNMQGLGSPIYPAGSRAQVFAAGREARVATYYRTFTVPSSWMGKRIYIAFDGAENGYVLGVNGKDIGSFRSAFNQSMFDVTDAVQFGVDNNLKVRVPQNEMKGWEFDTNDDWVFGGISRDVTLCALPETHFGNITIRTKVSPDKARIDIDVPLDNDAAYGEYSFDARVLNAEGEQVVRFSRQMDAHVAFVMDSFRAWSAEEPNLYTLQLDLVKDNKIIQQYETKFGLREVSWKDGVFRINGQPVKLKGVNRHDESPVNGRAVTEEEMLRDLRMMKSANINAIRTSHYPPSPHFMDMCDSLGFYVVCEVPFGFGDRHLDKPDYLEVLKERAWFTVQRDKNRPSVVIWSVGNENPNTANGFATGRYVHQLDSTRPYVFPQTHRPFNELLNTMPDSTEMFSAHYPLTGEYKGWSKKVTRPIMNTEYAHSLGTDMGQMQELVDLWYKDEKLAGGAVWGWADQGILKNDKHLDDRFAPTEYVWLTDSSYYDMQGILGTDGIVYPDRTPQTDYYQVRKVYSPVKILGLERQGNDYEVKIVNRYSFTALSDVTAHIELMGDSRVLSATDIQLNGMPGDTISFVLKGKPTLPEANFYYYNISLTDIHGEQFYEKSLRINDYKNTVPLVDKLKNARAKRVKLNAECVKSLIKEKVFARIGKKNTLAQDANVNGAQGKKHKIWPRHLLACDDIRVDRLRKNSYRATCVFPCDSSHYIEGVIDVTAEDYGVIDLKYNLTAHGDGEAVETGMTIVTDAFSDDTMLSWIGRGPFANYPGKDELSEFGVWQMDGGDLYFPGNRQDIEYAMLTDNSKAGMAIIPDSAKNICVERDARGYILISHNTHVANPHNKGVWAKGTVKTDGFHIQGGFKLMAVLPEWGPNMRRIFNIDLSDRADRSRFDGFRVGQRFAPFRASYDQ
jgi:beta-galactosidase